MEKKTKGYSYTVSKEQIEEYGKWPLKRKLAWLYEANKLRRFLPPEQIRTQDEFRRGEK